ncbi:hypothetical protein KJZ99_04195 [bacterium]|nr:hypothetical protein [bacterium]
MNSAPIGLCQYETKSRNGQSPQRCCKPAVEEINGHLLCTVHKKYGPTMDRRTDSEKIEAHNQGVEERNNGAAAQSAFTTYEVYADLCELTDRIEKHIKRVPKGRQVAAYLNSARLLLLDEMSSAADEVDPRQEALPLLHPDEDVTTEVQGHE